ncbi:MAG TPA: PepSY-like domain-containing protein [Bacteroidia bacterium]|jgi:hypothetical protein|nr:PepSY-like domain-containing protein [Bacteroidia bacterium]
MKAIIFATAIICLGATATYAQKIATDKVPTNVQVSFKKQFAQANKVEWEMEEADYEVNFKNSGVESSAKYNKDGGWLSTEQEIKKTELPASVKQAVDKDFPKAELDEIEKVTYPNNKTDYEMEVEVGKQKFEVLYSTEGKQLKKEEMKKEEKNKKEGKN